MPCVDASRPELAEEEEGGTGRRDAGAAAVAFAGVKQRIGAVTAEYAATADPAPHAASMSEVRLLCCAFRMKGFLDDQMSA